MDRFHDAAFHDSSMVFRAPIQRRRTELRASRVVAEDLPPSHRLAVPEPTPMHFSESRGYLHNTISTSLTAPRMQSLPALPSVLRGQREWEHDDPFRPIQGRHITTHHSTPRDYMSSPVRYSELPGRETKAPLDYIVTERERAHPSSLHPPRVAERYLHSWQSEPPRSRLLASSVVTSTPPQLPPSSSALRRALPSPPPPLSGPVRGRILPATSSPQPQTSDSNDAPEKKKRKARICTAEGCTKYVVDHGLCIRHGGGKRCYIEGCDCRAQNRGLCWKHGGFTICKVDGCTKRAKSRGICWSHGGGTRCKRDDCSKIAVSNGLCWAHGGGKRCEYERCRKPASERTNNMCSEHYAMLHGNGEEEV